ncbi:helix-turn-helix domain-containing protein, partial [Pseudokineococcus basanitobsidens]
MNDRTLDLRAGTTLWFEGALWRVQELGSSTVVLARGAQLRSVATTSLLATARLAGQDVEADGEPEPVGVVLDALKPGVLAQLEERAGHVRELLRPDSRAERARSTRQRYADKAAELGVSDRTLRRWVASYQAAGVVGLADSRLVGRYASGVDPRWDTACLRILDDLVDASTPTIGVVIARVARELEAEHGAGTVSLPSKATAYRRIKELSKGRHAFGSARGRRSVAARPQGVYGRLVATRPGEYVVLDS